MDPKPSFLQSKTFKGILFGLCIAAILLFTFEAGVYVGAQKAKFSMMWSKNYPQNFFPGQHAMPFPFDGTEDQTQTQEIEPGDMNDHGAVGEIIKIDQTTIVVKGDNEAEKNVLIQSDTLIERGPDMIKISDLQTGDHVVIFGSPNDSGQIQAKLVRVLPPHFLSYVH